MTAIEAYILARAYTRQAIEGAGALKGAPCQIQSIEAITGGNRITFAWETGEGETETDTLDVMDGADGDDGVGIASITYKETDAQGNNVYTVTLTSGSTYDITCPKGAQGETGATGATGNGIASISKTSTEGLVDTYTITYTNGSTSTFTVTNGATPTVDSEMSESSENPLQNKVITAWTSASTKSVTGNPITISDAAAVKAKALSVSIDPVQDLHGFDHPWVGGAGKNKLPLVLADIKAANTAGAWSGNVYTYADATVTVNEDTDGNIISITVNGTPSLELTFNVTAVSGLSGTKKIVGCPNDGAWNTYAMAVQDITTYDTIKWCTSENGETLVFDSAKTYSAFIHIGANTQVSNKVFKPMISDDTSDTYATFAPYTNYCPITGHTEASVQRDGKNLFDGVYKYHLKNMSDTGARSDNQNYDLYAYTLPAGTYTVSQEETETTEDTSRVVLFPSADYVDGTGTLVIKQTGQKGKQNYTFTLAGEINYILIQVRITMKDVQLEKGLSPTAYVPYSGKTYTIALGDTIYGGTVDFNTGVMTVTHGILDLGSIYWSYNGTRFATNNIPTKAYGVHNILCSGYPVSKGQTPLDANDFEILGNANSAQIYIKNSNYDDATVFTADISGIQLWYELATPFTVQLTPQQIQLLKGTNTLTANGASISLTYQPDNLVGEVMEQVEPQIDDLQGQIDEIPRLPDYSTTEQKTGQKWIDGNDIFVKSIEGTFGSGVTTGIQTFQVSTPNLKDVLKNEIVVGETDFVIGGYAPWYSSGTVLFAGITDSTLDIYLGGNLYAGKNFKCTVYYTKSTT